jgi:ribonuclease P protein component
MRGNNTPSVNFLLKTLKSPDGETRFAVSISKKVAPTAVLRNRTRRRVYSVLRDLIPSVRPGYLAGISVKKGGEKLHHSDIVKEIRALLVGARLM